MSINELANELIEIAQTIAKEKDVEVVHVWEEAVEEFKRKYKC